MFSSGTQNPRRGQEIEKRFLIREATESDLGATLELFFAVFGEPEFNLASKGFNLYERMQERYDNDQFKHEREFWGGDKNRRYVVVVHDRASGKMIGSAWLITKLDSTADQAIGEINKFYLLPQYRRLGLGDWLLRLLIGKAQELGFKTLFLITARELQAAVRLYQRYGFGEVPQSRYRNSPNSIAMERAC